MDSSTTLLLWASSILGSLVSLAVEAGLLIVAFGPVRKHRPDAWLFFAGAAGLDLLMMLMRFIATPILMHTLGPSSFLPASSAFNLFATLVHAASGVAILLGILRLAVPASGDPTRYE